MRTLLFTLIAAVVGMTTSASAATVINSDIDEESWTTAGSPYIVTTTIHVETLLEILNDVDVLFYSGAQLIINSGADLYIDGGYYLVEMKCYAGHSNWGGIHFAGSSSATIKRAKISDTSASYGGGVYMNNFGCTVDIRNTSFTDCYAYDGGAIYVGNGNLDLRNVTIKECEAGRNGGGIAITGGDVDIFTICEIVDNYALNVGGGISITGGSLSAEYCLIANNSWNVGGVFVSGGTVYFNQVTIAGNQQYGIYRNGGGTVSLNNSIVYATNGTDLGGGYTYSCNYCDIGSGLYSGTGNISTDPEFQDAYDYQFDYESPCADASSTGSWIGYHQDVTRPALAAPSPFALDQNAPNPFNPSTTIRFSVPSEGMVNLCVYSVSGQLINTLVSEEVSSGQHEVVWNGTDMNNRPVASGVYLYHITTAQGVLTQRMTLTR